MTRRISIVGLGKLGASMAAAIASRGHDVWGVDINASAVDALASGRAPVQETGLQDLIAANRDRLHATTSYAEAIRETELTFVIVPTPSDERGAFSLQYASDAFRQIGSALKAKSGSHTVVCTSTVLPGATRYGLLPVLEEHSGRRAGVSVTARSSSRSAASSAISCIPTFSSSASSIANQAITSKRAIGTSSATRPSAACRSRMRSSPSWP
jgi:nucleotide sugar dehydrogenase